MTFILPIIAVCLGFLLSLIFKPYITLGLKVLLSFSGAFLLSIVVFEILPQLYKSPENTQSIGIFIMGGLILQLVLEYLSRGAEHGHIHIDPKITTIPWVLLLSLSAHSLLEGFPLADNEDLLYGIVIHKIPIAIIISSFLMVSNINKGQIFVFLLIFALMTPLGSYLALLDTWEPSWKVRINALVVGALLHISTTILFESSKNHRFNSIKFLAILSGILLAFLL